MPPESIATLIYIDSTGYHYPDFPTILAWLVAQYQTIYGADVYINPDSQDGQWLSVQAQAIYDTASLGASVYNSFSPVTAQGIGLSRVVKINGLTREVPSFSTVTLTIVGTAGTVIANGIATDALNQQWVLPTSVTIPGGGSITVTATAAVVGAVFAEASTITNIFTPTNGWQTVNNSGSAVPGAPVESDAELRVRQAISTALPASTPLDSTVARVANVPGVTSVVGYENFTTSTQGVTDIPPHAISIVVAGDPDHTAVAQAILDGKTPGTNTYGPTPTTVTVFDNQGMPVAINYQGAIAAEIQVTVTLTTLSGWSDDFKVLIQNAVAAAINTLPVGGAGNGGTGGYVYLSTLFTAAALSGQPQAGTFVITGIEAGKNSGGQSAANIVINWDEISVCNPSVDVMVDT